jgi:glycine reductase complex component B subunit gamma
VAKELESCGIPAAQISALDALARSVGANRIVRGKAITSVVGDPGLSCADERRFRKRLVLEALEALRMQVAEPTDVG